MTPSDIALFYCCLLQAAINQSCDLNDDALEELSVAREPRQRDSVSVNSEADLPTFQEWCEGSAPQLDTDSLQKHVKQMVDVSVLKGWAPVTTNRILLSKRPWALTIGGQKTGVGACTVKPFVCITYIYVNPRIINKGGGRLHRDGHLLERIRY